MEREVGGQSGRVGQAQGGAAGAAADGEARVAVAIVTGEAVRTRRHGGRGGERGAVVAHGQAVGPQCVDEVGPQQGAGCRVGGQRDGGAGGRVEAQVGGAAVGGAVVSEPGAVGGRVVGEAEAPAVGHAEGVGVGVPGRHLGALRGGEQGVGVGAGAQVQGGQCDQVVGAPGQAPRRCPAGRYERVDGVRGALRAGPYGVAVGEGAQTRCGAAAQEQRVDAERS
ncbi:hypothetical protein GCM10010104_56390 [Streptomyces indiaensis]|uniref:Uncharacterized protein n=1 Tax=Streptomyces indiaensis TaxID=284033 RepID=A0ABN3EAD6_9ACTN